LEAVGGVQSRNPHRTQPEGFAGGGVGLATIGRMDSNYSELTAPPSWAAHLLHEADLLPEAEVLRSLGLSTRATQRHRWRTRRSGPRMPAIWRRFRWWTTAAAIREWMRRAPEIAMRREATSDAT